MGYVVIFTLKQVGLSSYLIHNDLHSMYVVNSFNVCGKSVSVFSTSTVYTVNPRFAFIRGGRFILSFIEPFTDCTCQSAPAIPNF